MMTYSETLKFLEKELNENYLRDFAFIPYYLSRCNEVTVTWNKDRNGYQLQLDNPTDFTKLVSILIKHDRNSKVVKGLRIYRVEKFHSEFHFNHNYLIMIAVKVGYRVPK